MTAVNVAVAICDPRANVAFRAIESLRWVPDVATDGSIRVR
jgi:hypothetical protein